MTDVSAAHAGNITLGDLNVRRMGFGAMRITGKGIWGAPEDPESAKALLDRNPRPSESDVRQALAANLCRCGTHNRIVRAVLRAANEMGRT